ncbi:MAG: MarC family protein [Planctomycetes bacterium]|nr:MarC family protein [Planctomycetota bacterium]
MLLGCLKAIITLLVVVDPIGNIPAFLAATDRFTPAQRHRAYTLSVVVSFAILLIFACLGQFILDYVFQIKIADIRIAGGILLLIITIRGLFNEDQTSQTTHGTASVEQIACVPLACPLLAGPGAMVTSLTVWQNPHAGPLAAIIAIGVVLAVFWGMMHYIDAISRVLGNLVITAASKVMLVFVGAIGVNMALQGILFYFSNPPQAL